MRISDWSSDVCSSDLPGTPSLMHRIGGIEKNVGTGHSDYDPANHQAMTEMRANKVLGVADSVAPQEVCLGEEGGKLAVVGWGSTYGPIHQAVRRMRKRGLDVSHIHIRHRSEEHTSELQSLMRRSYAVFCLKKKKKGRPTDRI